MVIIRWPNLVPVFECCNYLSQAIFVIPDSQEMVGSDNGGTPAMFVNDLSTLTQDPGIGFYMSGIPYQPGLSQFSNPAVVQISFRTNNVLYEITPNVGTGGNFYVDLVKTGLPNDTVELNMYGDIWVQDLNTGSFQAGTMSSFHGKFIRP